MESESGWERILEQQLFATESIDGVLWTRPVLLRVLQELEGLCEAQSVTVQLAS